MTNANPIKFPKTPRLAEVVAGDVHRTWRSLATVVEEKVDGANVGIFFGDGALRIQSRGHVLRGGDGEAQFAPLHAWAAERLARAQPASLLASFLSRNPRTTSAWPYAKAEQPSRAGRPHA